MTLASIFDRILAQQPAPPSGTDTLFSFLPIIFLFLAMWFLMIAPQRKKQKEHQKMIAALTTGDEVVTSGGIYCTITNVKPDRFVVKVADGTKLEIGKGFISALEHKADAVRT